jgi:2-polyprenyl-3-methyl-5-hydroxy-6-metoxy-1,4-benzoquinol methylase
MSSIHYSHCPVCKSTAIDPLLTAKDFSVSKEPFVIWQCSHCTLRFTQDVPDEASIGKYYQSPDYISHTNTNKGLLNQLYQKVRTFTLQEKASLVYHFTKQKGAILDMGAGTGAFLQVMNRKGWEIQGIEPDEGARSVARELYGLELQNKDHFYQLRENSFDAITLWHVLEHVQDLHGYVDRLRLLLKENGKLFIAVPNYTSLDAAVYKLYWAAYDLPRHLYHFSPRSMEVLMNEHGLRIIEQRPMWFDSFYISLISSKYRSGHINWLSAGWTALRSNLKAMFHKGYCSSVIYVIEKRTQNDG